MQCTKNITNLSFNKTDLRSSQTSNTLDQVEPAERPPHGPDPAAGILHGGAVLHDARGALLHGGLSHGDRGGQEQGAQFN